MADRRLAPINWEIVAAVKDLLEADTALTSWYDTTVAHGLVVLEHEAVVSPVRLQVGVEVSSVRREDRASCPKYITVFDLHVWETGSNTATANEALGRLEAAVNEKDSFVPAKIVDWGNVALRNINFSGRLGQAPLGDGWTVAASFTSLSYYYD